VYIAVFSALVFLTIVTVAASTIHWGSGLTNVIIAMLIASIKGSLVVLFFMHLLWDKRMNAIIFCGTLFFLGLFLISTYTDVVSRPPTEPTNLKSRNIPGGPQLAPEAGQLSGAGIESTAPPIPGTSPSGSYGGAATGTVQPAPQPTPQPKHQRGSASDRQACK
jgi:caa(3)-type oxidase subunit IV